MQGMRGFAAAGTGGSVHLYVHIHQQIHALQRRLAMPVSWLLLIVASPSCTTSVRVLLLECPIDTRTIITSRSTAMRVSRICTRWRVVLVEHGALLAAAAEVKSSSSRPSSWKGDSTNRLVRGLVRTQRLGASVVMCTQLRPEHEIH